MILLVVAVVGDAKPNPPALGALPKLKPPVVLTGAVLRLKPAGAAADTVLGVPNKPVIGFAAAVASPAPVPLEN